MKNKKIVIAGGTGFIGEEMIRYWGKDNYLIILTRKIPEVKNNRNKFTSLIISDTFNLQYVLWDARSIGHWIEYLENSDLLINLTGKSVNCRYTKKNKNEILNSRVHSTKILGEGIRRCQSPPKLWINASSATIYRDAYDKPQNEFSTEFHTGFSVDVCRLWEQAFFEQQTIHTRKIALRMAITLGGGGVLIPYFNLLKFGFGGKQGSGRQMYSWVHVEDTCRMIEWIYSHHHIEGVYNCSPPNPVTNKEFMKTLRKLTKTKIGLPAYEWMLKLGAMLIGTEKELVLKSRWVVPTKILETGFEFKYPDLEPALKQIIESIPRKQYKLL